MVDLVDEAPYTMRSRRSATGGVRSDALREAPESRFDLENADARPATPSVLPRPFGELSQATVDAIVERTGLVGSQLKSQRDKRKRGAAWLLRFLLGYPGNTWQERWIASGLDSGTRSIAVVTEANYRGNSKYKGYEVTAGLQALFLLRVIQPSLVSFRANKFGHYADYFVATQGDPDLARFEVELRKNTASSRYQDRALFDVAVAMTTQGIRFADLEPPALLHYSLECRRSGLVLGRGNQGRGHFAGLLAWDVCYAMGHFPTNTAPTLRASLYNGQKSAEQLVDRHGRIGNEGVRQLLVDYLIRRQLDTDYNTREGLASFLVKNFWLSIEQLSPGQADLNVSPELYDQWKEVARFKDNGELRVSMQSVLLPVRALYLDIQSWALTEPERWAEWAAPCPVPQSDLRGFAKRRREIKQRMDGRTRVRQPLLPLLVDYVERDLTDATKLLRATKAASGGEDFEVAGVRYRRTDSRVDQVAAAAGSENFRVDNLDTGEVVNAASREETAFWAWAYVEVLRHTGIRVEELVEITHTSLIPYDRPNGEVIPLLVIAPSKTDRERVIPCSPELFHVLALIISRQTLNGPISVIPRYDTHEKVMTDPLPFIFQRQTGGIRRVTSPGTVLDALKAACRRAEQTVPAFRGTHFTPHDFRRLFTTEILNAGLPIHIGAALLGHLNIETTRGYAAVFAEDVVSHFQSFLNRRRKLRPQEEYRPTTPEEWQEFEEHFDKRKLELGSCGRPYGTPCNHEHACIRCPMLHVDRKMLPRLDEIERDLLERLDRANESGWAGEIDGIEITLSMLRTKREETLRQQRVTTEVSLGMPSLRPD
ncbi:tyrosine-type recombinase/integrase [Nocardioides sp.]|uniref:tyrosine-type recombinase/integrase n=1 Tax=Nocardioides sp. TaxID=35761 RepID=UPI002B7D1129|nr:tyrosine-type recombinase/integrase [Nocardioides sp.]HXH80287.1 tyrosine-type recombinase/integrase [Nocardioides sp.]